MSRKPFIWVPFSLLAGSCLAFSCMKKPEATENQTSVTPVSKGAAMQGKLPVEPQEPLAPGHARVRLTLIKILPVESSDSSPCSLAPCKAEAQVDRVLGYGSAFGSPLTGNQKIQLYFPMTVKAVNGWPGLQEGSQLEAEIRSPMAGGSGFTVRKYSVRP